MKRLALVLAMSACATEELPASTIRDLSGIRGVSRIREVAAPPPNSCMTLSWPVDAPVSSGFGRRDGRPHP